MLHGEFLRQYPSPPTHHMRVAWKNEYYVATGSIASSTRGAYGTRRPVRQPGGIRIGTDEHRESSANIAEVAPKSVRKSLRIAGLVRILTLGGYPTGMADDMEESHHRPPGHY